ncbi:hypothetical protein H7T43_22295 [Peribacillus simplex]|uniref:hypothetical protein n=1 Tax=Peribacillus TaxID=2675229 RepID=UPI002161B28A|nr:MULTISPECIES: hypothetical protein [Peribacillus]MBX9957608.1 hypothetical protein [Peribacillus simplex]
MNNVTFATGVGAGLAASSILAVIINIVFSQITAAQAGNIFSRINDVDNWSLAS